jgi:S-DNA-T family DNA segregation ATPase FtsK/SpoIIIE
LQSGKITNLLCNLATLQLYHIYLTIMSAPCLVVCYNAQEHLSYELKMTKKKTTSTTGSKKKATTRKKKVTARTKTTRGGTGSKRKPASRSSTRKKTTRSPRKKTTRKKPSFSLNLPQKALISGLAILILTAIFVLSLISPNQGQLTSALASLIWQAFGWGGVMVPIITAVVGVYLILWGMENPPKIPVYRMLGFTLFFIAFAVFASIGQILRENALNDFWAVAESETGGGYFGGIVGYALTEAVGTPGTILILVVVAAIGVILLFGVTRTDMGNFLQALMAFNLRNETEDEFASRDIPINTGRNRSGSLRRSTSPDPSQLPLPEPETATSTSSAKQADTEKPEQKPEPKRKRGRRGRKQKEETPPAQQPTVQTPVFVGGMSAQTRNWKVPALTEMLAQGNDQDTSDAMIREQVEIIEHTLESFGAPATVVEINQGPTITQFGVEPNYLEMRSGKRTKVKVGKIASLGDDLALALQARSIRIQAPVPGKGYVGIEVPNTAKALVSLRDVMESDNFQKIAKKSSLAIGLGQDVAGNPISADLTTMPHLLIAGTTGAGKSVCVNSIIACLLLQNTPDDLKLVMVDPKRVELTGYNGIPHLAAPVVVDMDRVIGTLQWAMREMDSRYKMFADMGARNITDYNKKIRRRKDVPKMAHIIIIIDELADLMMLSPEDTERGVTRLAQMARATGIHMIIATQRPSVDVVTGLIKANFPARIAFAVASSTDSRVILDSTGAERLLGQGDMLFQSPDAAAPARLQGCFVSDEELSKLIAYWQRARRFSTISMEEAAIPKVDTSTLPPPSRAQAPPPETSASSSSANGKSTPASKPAAKKPLATAPLPISEEPIEGEIVGPEPDMPTQAIPVDPPPPETTTTQRPLTTRPLLEELQAIEEENKRKQQFEDELMPDAIAMVRQLNKASTSLLQRRFRIGYTRAARMIDAMEDMGIIGPPTGTSKAREVLPWQDDSGEPESEIVEEGE